MNLNEAQLKAKKEQLELKTANAASSDKLKVFEDNDDVQNDMSDYFKSKTSIKAESRGALRLKEKYGDHPLMITRGLEDIREISIKLCGGRTRLQRCL